ncbi:hypothetical protein CLV81_3009 [Flagellimonas meridianipacifica]|uniref:Uncharacterized protein n=1 Tax=Flagellimonas meridianipacifica TaxID=1080225 RepID=A0A2T0MAS2_9FLAO|nr:hypothetical protein CLV81_3009 [Allomuricauda pacifica]
MATRNGLSSPTLQLRPGQASENPLGFSVWYVFAKISANPHNSYNQDRYLQF